MNTTLGFPPRYPAIFRVSRSGTNLIISDFVHEPFRSALQAFRVEQRIEELIEGIDLTGVFCQRRSPNDLPPSEQPQNSIGIWSSGYVDGAKNHDSIA